MIGSLAGLAESSQRQNRGALSEGLQSLNRGMESWLGSMKERHQKRTMVAIQKLIQQDKIPWGEVNKLLADVDIDPVAMMQGLEPAMANQKRQQFQQAGPVIAGIITNALSSGDEVPMDEIMSSGMQQGLGFRDVLAVLKGLQDSGLVPTIEQKGKEKNRQLNTLGFSAKYNAPITEDMASNARKLGIEPTVVPGASAGNASIGQQGIPQQRQPIPPQPGQGIPQQRPQQELGLTPGAGMVNQPPATGMTGMHKNVLGQSLFGGRENKMYAAPPPGRKTPTTMAGIAATDFPLFEKTKQAEAKARAKYAKAETDKKKLMTFPEKRARGKELRETEKRILNPANVEAQQLQVDVEFFNENTDKPYIYVRKQGEEKSFLGVDFLRPDTSTKIEKVDVSTPEKIRDSSLSREQKVKLLKERFEFE